MAEWNKNRASGWIYVAAAKTTATTRHRCWCHVFFPSKHRETRRRQQVSVQPLIFLRILHRSQCVSMGIIEIRRGAEALPRATLIDWVPPSAVLQRTHPIAIYFLWTRARQVSLKFRCPMIQGDGDRSRARQTSVPRGSSSADGRVGD